jgi:aspartate kinase
MHVFKFGGASVKDAAAVRNLLSILQAHADLKPVVVISAMGKTTNHLEEITRLAIDGRDYKEPLARLREFHENIATELLGVPGKRCAQFLDELAHEAGRVSRMSWVNAYDRLVAYGELMSTAIIEEFLSRHLQTQWMDARSFIRTDAYHTEANIDWVETEDFVNKLLRPVMKDRLVITQGFIGSAPDASTTTLGREGSDFTAAILAHCLGAESMTVWKDVPGILNADPKRWPNTEQFGHLSYREATEMTYYGATVIHPKTLKPLAQKHIPLIVRSFLHLDKPGTQITEQATRKTIPVYIFKENQLLVTAEVKDHSFMDEKKLGMILQSLDILNIKINLMQNSALTFSFCMDYKPHKLERILELLAKDFVLTHHEPLKLITVKNHSPEALAALPEMNDILLEQKTKGTYQVLYA